MNEHRTEQENLQAKRTQDRRVRKTKALLRHCLAELMKTKKINEITVKELADMSDLNRGTFYLHYRDVYDLLEQTENELMADFDQALSGFDAADFRTHPAPLFSRVFSLIRENQDIVGILMGENGDLHFQNRLKKVVEEKCLRALIEDYRAKNSEQFMVFHNFLLSGCIGIVQYWVRTGCRETPEALAALTERILTDGLSLATKL